MIPRTALRPGTKTVRGRLVDDMKNGRVKSRVVAAEAARDARHDVHAGIPALKALRMIVSLAATREGKHRPRSIVFYDIVAASKVMLGFFRAREQETISWPTAVMCCWIGRTES